MLLREERELVSFWAGRGEEARDRRESRRRGGGQRSGGASAALTLSTYDVPDTLITREHQLADTPRVHITNQRTMEIMRDFGLEQEVVVEVTPQHLIINS